MSILSVVRPKEPINPTWQRRSGQINTGYAHAIWYHPGLKLFAISAVEKTDDSEGPEYHLSISKKGRNGPRRCSAAEAKLVLQQFDLDGATEDNHTSITRNYWRPVADRDIGLECDCKDQEAVIIEGDFEWRPLTQKNADQAKRIQESSNDIGNNSGM